jgi:hypothetical protein
MRRESSYSKKLVFRSMGEKSEYSFVEFLREMNGCQGQKNIRVEKTQVWSLHIC